MADACFTYYKIKGKYPELCRLYYKMEMVRAMYNEMERTSLKFLTFIIGWDETTPFGYFSELEFNNEYISFMLETEWTRSTDFEKMILESFPGIEIIYYSESDGDETYETNDRTGEFFPERYIFETEFESKCEPTIYCNTEKEVLGYVKDVLGKEFKTVTEAQEWLEDFNETAEEGQHTKIITIRVN